MTSTFKEEQKFTQWWLWVIVVGMAVIPLFGIYQQIILDKPIGDKPMSDLGLIVFTGFTFALIVMMWRLRLKTEIDNKEIRVKLRPFSNKTIEWKEVDSAEIIQYGFIGGWGLRLWTKYGTVYNTGGNKGLALVLKNGKKYLIGTQRDIELKTFITRVLSD